MAHDNYLAAKIEAARKAYLYPVSKYISCRIIHDTYSPQEAGIHPESVGISIRMIHAIYTAENELYQESK